MGIRTGITISPGCIAFAILVFVMLVVAGCATVQAPGSPLVPTPAKTSTPSKVTATVTIISPVKTLRTLAPVTTPPTTSPSSPATTPPESRYSVETCPEMGGFIVSPGDSCPGSWLDTTGTFSCCSQKPVPESQANLTGVTAAATAAARPLDLRVNLTYELGRIVP